MLLAALTINSNSESMYLDFTVFLLGVQFAELGFLLIIVDRSDEDDDDDGSQDGDTLDPGNLGVSSVVGSVVAVVSLCGFMLHSVVLVDSQSDRDNSSNQQQDL